MATDTLKGGIPFIALDSGYQIVFEAIDAATGAAVAGVNVTNVAVYGTDLAASQHDETKPPVLAEGLLPG